MRNKSTMKMAKIMLGVAVLGAGCGTDDPKNFRTSGQNQEQMRPVTGEQLAAVAVPTDSNLIMAEDFSSGTWTNSFDTYFAGATQFTPSTSGWSIFNGALRSGKTTNQGTNDSVALIKAPLPSTGYSMELDLATNSVINWLSGVLSFPSVTFGYVSNVNHYWFYLTERSETKTINGVTYRAIGCTLAQTKVNPQRTGISSFYDGRGANICGYVKGITRLKLSITKDRFVAELVGAQFSNPLALSLPRGDGTRGRAGALKKGNGQWDNFIVRKLP